MALTLGLNCAPGQGAALPPGARARRSSGVAAGRCTPNRQAKANEAMQPTRGNPKPATSVPPAIQTASLAPRLMRHYHHITALFGLGEDTLHVAAGRPCACYESRAPSGMVYRFAPVGNRPTGVRIAGFLARWGERRDQAYAEIARFLGADRDAIRDLVEAQLAEREARADLRRPGSRPLARRPPPERRA
jgi:hypothetical protein